MENMLKRLEEIVGSGNVLTDPSVLAQYAGERAFAATEQPMAVVKAHSGTEVEQIVNLALEANVPLTPVSSGAPHSSPSSAPSVPGSVIVDLSEMKKIISINRTFSMVIIEPGVTYSELLDALKKEGLTLNLPLAPKKNKSVIADLLEVNPRRNAALQWNYIDPLRCTEVTFGDGNRQFTGEAGGGALDLAKQQSQGKWQINGAGPMMLDFCRILAGAQGTTGIVTWASVKCEPIETIKKNFVVKADSFDKLNDFAHEILKWRFADGMFLLNGKGFEHLLGQKGAAWQTVVEIAGRNFLPEMKAAQQEADITDLATKYGLKMEPADELQGPMTVSVNEAGAAQQAARLFFTTTMDEVPAFEAKMRELASEAGYPTANIGIYVQPQHQGTNVHLEFVLPYCDKCKSACEKLFRKASQEVADMGGYYARPYGIWAEIQYAKDAENALVLKRLYDIFNPKGILNPGKLLAKQADK